jgi:hypothetical protein
MAAVCEKRQKAAKDEAEAPVLVEAAQRAEKEPVRRADDGCLKDCFKGAKRERSVSSIFVNQQAVLRSFCTLQ